MLENLVAMLENVVSALGGKMTIMETLFVDLGYSFGPIGQETLRIHNKFILCSKNKISISIASFISHICLFVEKI